MCINLVVLFSSWKGLRGAEEPLLSLTDRLGLQIVFRGPETILSFRVHRSPLSLLLSVFWFSICALSAVVCLCFWAHLKGFYLPEPRKDPMRLGRGRVPVWRRRSEG